MDHSKEMVRLAYEALSDKKGEDIRIIDILPTVFWLIWIKR